MARAHLVVIEDEQAIRRGVVDALQTCDYEVSEAGDGVRGLELASRPGVDLILLDLLLPRLDGLELLTQLRKTRPTVPVIILTARGSEDDRVRGLKMGADDYVVKPFSARELLARVEAVLRRSPRSLQRQGQNILTVRLGRATIDLQRREISWGVGERAELSETENAILRYLVQHRERAVSREELLSEVWGIEPAGLETRTIDMHVARLRMKLRKPLGESGLEPILTVRSHGYMAGPDLLPVEASAAITATAS